MRRIACAALVWSCAFVGAAQTPVAKVGSQKQPPPGVLHSVTVKGNQRYSSADIVKESGLVRGERITPSAIEQARLKLQSTELFNKVDDDFRWNPGNPPAYDITFDVSEIPEVYPLRFERLGVSADTMTACLKTRVPLYSDEIPATEGVLRRYTEAAQECVQKNGGSVKVKAAVSNDDPKQLSVLFSPNTPPPNIAQVTVTGNQVIDSGTILRAVNPVAIGAPLTDTRVKQILDGTIKRVYAAKGYVAVSFPKIEAIPSKTNEGVVLNVQIQEGPQFNFGQIRFRGSAMDPEEVKA
ncbi:MAG: hypothetical protein JO061_08820, partial [Acidobacteriaceae bacterium]|nr:hypothetical protein [Acidobacteriaceae bacterium]